MNRMNFNLIVIKYLILVVSGALLISISACSQKQNEGLYEAMQGIERDRADCGPKAIDDNFCDEEELSYEDYQREREALLKTQ